MMKVCKYCKQEKRFRGGTYCSRVCYVMGGDKTWFKEGHEDYNKREEESPNWKGDKVKYIGLHQWLYRNYGKADRCEYKECRKNSKTYQWANMSKKYLRDRKDFKMLCASCHARFDKGLIEIGAWVCDKKI